MEAIVRLQSLDGTWETCGSDRLRGIHPQGVQLTANDWGPDGCSFQLHRDPRALHPDLSAYTPCEFEIGGKVVWDGRVWETPTRDGDDAVISVQGRGWQYHLDDDTYERAYVHTRMSDWRDIRTFLGSKLAYATQAGQVSSDRGAISIGWPKGHALSASEAVGVQLDLGPGNTAKRVVLEWESSNNSSAKVYLTADDDDEVVQVADTVFTFAVNSAASGTTPGTLTTARRYLGIFLWGDTGAGALAADVWLKINAIRVFADTAYESGNQSVLKADTVFKDALDKATSLLSPDRSGIAAADFSLPDFVLDGDRSPREVGQAVNAFHGWRQKIAVGRIPIFAPLPNAPLFEIGDWPGGEFADASANSGEEIYNRVKVQGTGPDGAPLRAVRRSSDLVGKYPAVEAISTPAPDNPSFDVDTASWTPSAGTIVRDTASFQSSPASGRWSGYGDNAFLATTFTGTFKAGVTYQLAFYMKADATPAKAAFQFGDYVASTVDYTTTFVVALTTSYLKYTVTWTPLTDRTTTRFRVIEVNSASPLNIDSLGLSAARPTLIDRRGFLRTKTLPVQAALPLAGAEKICDVFLALHRTTPLKGTAVIAPGGARRVLGGGEPHPSELLIHTTELLRLSNRTDPDSGGHGRDGVIHSVSYDHDSEIATVPIDNDRRKLDNLLARYTAVVGAGR